MRTAARVRPPGLAGFALDPRSLAAFRIALALVAAADLAGRFALRRELYGPDGILDFSTWAVVYGGAPYAWTLHGDGPLALALAFAVHAAAILCVLAGVRVRTAALVAALLGLSLGWRNPLLAYGGEKLASLLFLALACAYRPARAVPAEPSSAEALGGFFLRSQMAITYVVAGLAKLGSDAWTSGDALSRATRLDLLVQPLGIALASYDGLLRAATYATPAFEIVAPALLLLPSGSAWRDRARALAVLLLLGFDLGIRLTLDVGLFMAFASAGFIAMLPAFVWESRLGRPIGERLLRSEPIAPAPLPSPASRAAGGVLAVVLATLSWLTAFESVSGVAVGWPPPVWNGIRAFGLYQQWDMFTNLPRKPRWFVARARLRDGAVVDLLEDGAAVDFRRRRGPNALFADEFRWRLAFAKAGSRWKEEALRLGVARGLVTWWNARHPPGRRVERLEIFRLEAPDLEDYARRTWRIYATWEQAPDG